MGRVIALPVAQRAWMVRSKRASTKPYRPLVLPWPEHVLILDTETTTDPSQRLLFGSWRYGRFEEYGAFVCEEEGLIHADDLAAVGPQGWDALQSYAATHESAATNRRRRQLLLLSRRQFVQDRLWKALHGGAMLVGYNLAFDLTRLAVGVGESRHPLFDGGFSLPLFEYEKDGLIRESKYRPRIRLKPLDSKRTLMGVSGRLEARPNEAQERVEGAHGRMLDLKQLAFALTDTHVSLDGAAAAFGVEARKATVEGHGTITEFYIDYNRQDVEVTGKVLEALRAEWDRHPLALSPDKVMSPAGLAKGYLRAMGITPPDRKFADIGPSFLGACMSSYYGGRAEVRIRRQVVPVVYVDFLSMYPTVNSLLGLWRMLTAERLKLKDATAEVQHLLTTTTREDCFQRSTWDRFRFFAKIRPQGDILPVRAPYGPDESNCTIGVNPLWSDLPLWFAGPDLMASVLLTGHVPEILEAIRLDPAGQQDGLKSVDLRGQVTVNPADEDFFRRLIEERQRTRSRPDLSSEERERLRRFLKVLANSGSYGIYAELNPQPTVGGETETVEVYGNDAMYSSRTSAPEEPGEYSFPPFAALTTSGARLMLALLERQVKDLGGEIAFGDTDSGAIVASAEGGLVPCMGGAERLPDSPGPVHALTWAQVQEVAERFKSLSPYDRDAVPGSILKIEDNNFDPATKAQRQLYAFAISAKRYALFVNPTLETIEVVDAKEHGLGHLLNPTDLDASDRDWILEVWMALIRDSMGGRLLLPRWVDRPALSRVTVSTIGILKTFDDWNAEKSYVGGVKPMNFGLSAHLASFGAPDDRHPERFHLLGPYEKDASKWLTMPWFDKYSGKQYRIGVGPSTPGNRAQVKSYRDVIEEYRVHPEPKSLGNDGKPCGKTTVGLLFRRPVRLGSLVNIGKESNKVEQVHLGLMHSRREVQETHIPPQRAFWDLIYVPAIRRIDVKRLCEATARGRREVHHWRKGTRRPPPRVERQLRQEAELWAREAVQRDNCLPEDRVIAERVLAATARSFGLGPPSVHKKVKGFKRPSTEETAGADVSRPK